MGIAEIACPSMAVLELYLRDVLAEEEASRVDSHVNSCPSCQGLLSELMGPLPDEIGGISLRGPLEELEGRIAEEAPPELPGFETVARIASGGMGIVWRVHDLQFERTLAIKVMKRRASRQPELVHRFYQEARLCAQLVHPFIVPIHAMGRLPDGRPYYTMKLVEGETLAERLERRQSPDQDRMELLQIFGCICQAMALAHRHAILHRDLKPQNVMLGKHGEVQLMDWGLAKLIGERERAWEDTVEAAADTTRAHGAASDSPDTAACGLAATAMPPAAATQDGDVLGTLAYMPPEQARGQIDEVDRRSDVFGLGAILCEILTGAAPYTGRDIWSVRSEATEGRLDGALARLHGCGADSELIDLAERCLAPNTADRPADAGVVAAAVAVHLDAVQERSRRAEWERSAGLVARFFRRCRQRPLVPGLTMALALTAILIAAVLVTRPSNTLRVGIKPWVGFSPLAVADDLNLCKGIDLVLEPVEDHEDALQKLAKGQIDVVLCPVEGHVYARAAGYRTKAVLKLDDSLTADAIVAREDIRTPSDLVGKSIVYVQMDAPHYLLAAFAERHGLNSDAVTLIAAKTAKEALDQFIHAKEGEVAAVAIYEPYLQEALEKVKGAHLLTTAEREAGAIVDILTVGENCLSSNSEKVQALVRGWFEAVDLLKDRNPQAIRSACKFLAGKDRPPIEADRYDLMAAGMKYSDKDDNRKFFQINAHGGSEFRSRMSAAHDRLSKQNHLRETTKANPEDVDGSALLFEMDGPRDSQ
jgi:serine/threonine protein kinase/ABC-type nitrate/sulfonate/bicarbonate transport system substrate-binding protein